MPPSIADLLAFVRRHRYAIQASSSATGPQAAIVGIVISDSFDIFFDTIATTRKAANLRKNPNAAFVVGSTDAGADCTLQIEGIADEPSGADLERLTALYFQTFPDGRERQSWPGLTYFRVKPGWMRWSNFAVDPPEIIEFTSADLIPNHPSASQ